MAEHNDDMTYKSRFHFMCSCYRLPEDGSFTVGQEYAFVNTIDVVEIVLSIGPKEVTGYTGSAKSQK